MASKKILVIAQMIRQSLGLLDSPGDDAAMKIIADATNELIKLSMTDPGYNPVPVGVVATGKPSDPTGEGFRKNVIAQLDELFKATEPPIDGHTAIHQCVEELELDELKTIYDQFNDSMQIDLLVTAKGQQNLPDLMANGDIDLATGFGKLVVSVVAGLRADEVTWDVKEEDEPADSDLNEPSDTESDTYALDVAEALDEIASAPAVSAAASTNGSVVRDPAVDRVLQETAVDLADAITSNDEDDAKDKVSSAVCKKAIVSKLINEPMTVCTVLGIDYDPDREEEACLLKNWKRVSKSGSKKSCERVFSCEGFEGKLKATVKDDGASITDIAFAG